MNNSFKFLEKLKGRKLEGVSYGYGQEMIYLKFGKSLIKLDVTDLDCITEKL